jgi:hypothetical protein
VPGNVCPNDPAKRVSGAEAFAALGGTAAINKLGFFLRTLSAVYSLADCERLVEEMVERTNLGLPTSLPAMHCQFALDDVDYVFSNAKVPLPVQYQALLTQLPALKAALASATTDGGSALGAGTAAGTAASLPGLIDDLRRLRNGIAFTPQLAGTPLIGAPALGMGALAVLAMVLFAVPLIRLRRRG